MRSVEMPQCTSILTIRLAPRLQLPPAWIDARRWQSEESLMQVDLTPTACCDAIARHMPECRAKETLHRWPARKLKLGSLLGPPRTVDTFPSRTETGERSRG